MGHRNCSRQTDAAFCGQPRTFCGLLTFCAQDRSGDGWFFTDYCGRPEALALGWRIHKSCGSCEDSLVDAPDAGR